MRKIYKFEAENNLFLTVDEVQPAEQVIVNFHRDNETITIGFEKEEFSSFCSLPWRIDHLVPIVQPTPSEPSLLEVLC
jgi:hypothetical protein